MKTEHEITVRLLIDATPALSHMLGILIGALSRQQTAPANDEQTAPAAEAPIEAPKTEATEPVPEAPANDKQTAPAEAPEDEEPKPAIFSAADVRESMEQVRLKLEGPDYADRQGDPKAKALHRALTAAFKNVSSILGAEKPSGLEADKRGAFIQQIEQLAVKADGSIGIDQLPF